MFEMHRRAAAELKAVERPGVAFHIAGQVQFDFARRPARVERAANRGQIGQRQYLATIVAQTNARIIKAGAWHIDAHIGARAILRPGVVDFSGWFGQRIVVHHVLAMIHCHRTMPHIVHVMRHRHGAVIHARHLMTHGCAVHSRHCPMAHAPHAAHHVGHGQPFDLVKHRHRHFQSGTHGQRAAGVATAIHGLGKDRMCFFCRLDQYIVGFTRAEAEFVDGDRFDIDAIRLDDRQLQARNTHVVKAIGGTIDEAQANPLAGTEKPRPVASRGRAIHQVGIGGCGQIGEISRIHAHFVPHLALLDCCSDTAIRDITEEIADRWLAVVVVVALDFEFGEHMFRILVGPVRQLNNIVTIRADCFAAPRFNDDRPVHSRLLLMAGMRVIPVSTALLEAKTIGECFPGGNAGETDAGNPIHLEGQEDTVPMNRGGDRQTVVHPDGDHVAFAQAQGRRRQRAVDGRRQSHLPGKVYGGFRDCQLNFGSG